MTIVKITQKLSYNFGVEENMSRFAHVLRDAVETAPDFFKMAESFRQKVLLKFYLPHSNLAVRIFTKI